MHRATRFRVLPGLLLLASLQGLGCIQTNQGESARTAKAAVDKTIVIAKEAMTANRKFGVDLYQQLARDNPGENLFFSPYSVSSALTLAIEGARGETALEMGHVLGFTDQVRRVDGNAELTPWKTDVIHAGMSALNQRFLSKPIPQELRDQIATLRKDLDEANQRVTELLEPRKPGLREAYLKAVKTAEKLNATLAKVDQYEIRVANALWCEQTYPFEPTYLATIRKFYGTDAVFPVDFKNNAEPARQQINMWVEDQTNKRIRELMPPMSVDSARMVLTNAVYFKGEWQEPFLERSTLSDAFTIAGGTRVQVPMMNQNYKPDVHYAAFNADGTYFSTPTEVPARRDPDPKTIYPGMDGFLMLEIPYKGGEISLIALLPQDPVGLTELEQKITGDRLQEWIGKLEQRNVHVFLPKFKLQTNYSMKETLAAMGMERAFADPRVNDGAQFEGLSARQDPDQRLSITDVLHKAYVEVNEKGTEAAAATALPVGVSDGSFDEPTVPFTPTFQANRPFLFLIRDIKTGTVLFLGRMVRPIELEVK